MDGVELPPPIHLLMGRLLPTTEVQHIKVHTDSRDVSTADDLFDLSSNAGTVNANTHTHAQRERERESRERERDTHTETHIQETEIRLNNTI